MAIFTTIIQQPLAVHCNIDSAFCAEQIQATHKRQKLRRSPLPVSPFPLRRLTTIGAKLRQHIMPEVSGTEITVTKKANVIKLDQQPPLENNVLQDESLRHRACS
jgi:hypothetical protein